MSTVQARLPRGVDLREVEALLVQEVRDGGHEGVGREVGGAVRDDLHRGVSAAAIHTLPCSSGLLKLLGRGSRLREGASSVEGSAPTELGG